MRSELKALFSGYVQGCGFRYYTYQLLSGHPVCGSVRNLPDGRVELVLQGERGAIEDALEEVMSGRQGRITELELEWRQPLKDLDGFKVEF